MEAEIKERLLASIAANRLVLFCGAGLSMSAPSHLPSARELAQSCAEQYELEAGQILPPELHEDLEQLAEYFHRRDILHSTFLRLVPRRRFLRDPNRGHFAAADFISSGVVECIVSTNVDGLIEEAEKALGEPQRPADIDGDEANTRLDRKPHLKIHGCLIRDERNTLWCRSQLTKGILHTRHEQFKKWLSATLRERDLVFLGFWSDWAYLNDIFQDVLGGIDRCMVVIVNPSDDEALKQKALRLWEWSSSDAVTRFIVRESADSFLDELRAIVWRNFLEYLHKISAPTYAKLTGKPVTPPQRLPDGLSADDLYALHLDVSGVPQGEVARKKHPEPAMEMLGAVQLGLLARGAALEGNQFVRGGKRFRVVHGGGRLVSAVRKRYEEEVSLFTPADTIICVGAKDDGGVPVSVARAVSDAPTIVRSRPQPEWLTEEQATVHWRSA